MNIEINKPYVLSADVFGSLKKWSKKTGYDIPKEDYFQGMLVDLQGVLKGYFPRVDVVPEEYLQTGLRIRAQESANPVISLDQVYISPTDKNIAGFLSTSRSVNPDLSDAGLVSRGETDIDTQIRQFANSFRGKPVTLLDDVIFGGKTIQEIIGKFSRVGIPVSTVIAGIAIQERIDLLAKDQIRVDALVVYSEVIDEICVRDFVPGTPNSGRTIIINKKRYGAPYLLPFGKPNDWANIPKENEKDFSLFCVSQSADLWGEIEQKSQATVPTKALAKPIFGLSEDTSVAKALIKVREQLKNGGDI